MSDAGLGHNSGEIVFEVEVRLFNSIARQHGSKGHGERIAVEPGTTVGDIAMRYGIAEKDLHLVLVNGRDVTPGLVSDPVRRGHQVEPGDVVALSGPVPYSYGYGAPVV
jgi:hypothetical protein